jgi:hypothetical protein
MSGDREEGEPQEPAAAVVGVSVEGDEYEEYMANSGKAIYRQKMKWPWYLSLLFPMVLVFIVGLALATGGPWWPFLIQFGLAALIMAMFYALRVAVTREHVYLQYGLLGPKIKVEDIVHCEAETYKLWHYGGYGVRYSLSEGTWAFNMIGDKGKAVRIHYKSKYAIGGVRKVVVSSEHPHVLADSINRVRAAKGHELPDLSDEALGLGEGFGAVEEGRDSGGATLPAGLDADVSADQDPADEEVREPIEEETLSR